MARLAGLLDHPAALADSEITFDDTGRGIRVHRVAEDGESVSLAVEQFVGGKPSGRTFTVDGARLADALAGLAD